MAHQEMNIIHDETPAPYVPSDEELDRAVAEVCGWVNIARQPYGFSSVLCGINPDSDLLEELPNYCTDRNALPELWRKVESEGKHPEMIAYLLQRIPDGWPSGITSQFWMMLTATPRTITFAALQALGKWRQEWRTE